MDNLIIFWISTIISLFLVVTKCFILKKLDIKWYYALIPFYGTYKLFKATNTKIVLFYIYLIVEVLGLVGSVITYGKYSYLLLEHYFYFSNNYGTFHLNYPIINFFARFVNAGDMLNLLEDIYSIYALVIDVLVSINLGKKFKKSNLFIIGMCCLPFVFYSILAFGKSEIKKEVVKKKNKKVLKKNVKRRK